MLEQSAGRASERTRLARVRRWRRRGGVGEAFDVLSVSGALAGTSLMKKACVVLGFAIPWLPVVPVGFAIPWLPMFYGVERWVCRTVAARCARWVAIPWLPILPVGFAVPWLPVVLVGFAIPWLPVEPVGFAIRGCPLCC